MKLIIAIIQPHRLEEVKKALKRIRSAPNLDEDVALHE